MVFWLLSLWTAGYGKRIRAYSFCILSCYKSIMDAITIRLQPETIENLDEEYEERGFRNRTLYLRTLIDQRDAIFDDEGGEIDAAERLAEHDDQLADHDDRLDDLNDRLGELEEQARPFSWSSRSS